MSYIGQNPTAGTLTGVVKTISSVAPDLAGNINIVAGTDIGVVPGVNSVTINFTGPASGLDWSVETGVYTVMAPNHGYIPNRAGAIGFELPAVSAVGDIIKITSNMGAALPAHYWTVFQGAGQRIWIENQKTTTGAGGSMEASNSLGGIPYTCIEMVCIVANLEWMVISQIHGELTTA